MPRTKTSPDTSSDPNPPETPPVTETTTISAPRFLQPSEPSPRVNPQHPSMGQASDTPEMGEDAGSPHFEAPRIGDEPLDEAPETKTGSSGASRASFRADRAAFEEAAEVALVAVTTMIHEQATAGDPLAQELDLWLADEQDVAGISKPAAGLLARRSSTMGGGNPDLADLIGLAIGVTGYVLKQLGKLRLMRKATRAGLDTQIGAGDELEQPA